MLKKRVINLQILYLFSDMRYLFSFLFISLSFISFSQNNYSKSFSLLSDNDLYTSTSQDRYYTNGLFLAYRFLKENTNENLEKKIITYQLGHMIFTPIKSTLKFPSLHDRPFAGYLFGEYGINRFYKTQNIFETNFQIGVIGPKSQANELQNFIHSIYGFPKATGWEHQIKEAVAINSTIKYIHFLGKNKTEMFDISSYNSLNAGTIFTNISTGLYARIGFKKLRETYNSIAFNSNLNVSNTKQKGNESFLYLKPLLSYVLYDATIQGSFLNTDSTVTYDVMPWNFTLEAGFRYATQRFDYGYTIHYHTKKLKSIRVKNSNIYGSVFIGYKFN